MRHALMLVLFCIGCSRTPPLTVEMPLHLEEHVGAAVVTGSELPANPPAPVEWRFDQPQPDWKPPLRNPPIGPPTLTRTGEGLRVTLTHRMWGVIQVGLPDWSREDWADVVIRARADNASSVNRVGLGFSTREGRGTGTNVLPPFAFWNGHESPVVRDGTIQTYRLRVNEGARSYQGPWRHLALYFGTDGEPGSIELLSVSVVPAGAVYSDSSHGVRPVTIGDRIRRTVYTHAPGRLSYRVRVPAGGRLDTNLGVLSAHDSVTFRVAVQAGGDEATLLEERYADPEQWAQRSIDLSAYSGRTVTLTLETKAEQPGTVAFWGAPTVSGARSSSKPNVIFYVIDGGGADQMSVYGYNRRTTPNLERLASEGALFEHAYSNASWTQPSTASFVTSLHSSVLGLTTTRAGLPKQAVSMAERFHRAGYQTAILTSNPNAGFVSGYQRGADVFRDRGDEPTAGSSVQLHREFWDWRTTSPGEPYWVHFQTTDVHADLFPPAPFAGLFATPDARDRLNLWDSIVGVWQDRNADGIRADPHFERKQFDETGIGRQQYFDLVRSMYDESMSHQDYQLGRFVERLRETGQWENTLLIIAADHGITAALDVDPIVPLSDTLPRDWRVEYDDVDSPFLRSSTSHVPLMFVWPGRIAGGQRFRQPVSMIDVLPTVLELVGLPLPEVLQGQSLVPLLFGQAGWEARPVIVEEAWFLDSGELGVGGQIEMIDGRWGASLRIGPPLDGPHRRPTPLLLFDVWNDPLALTLMNDEHPDLVKKYTSLLQQQWAAHRLLATRFTAGTRVELTPQQLETLRALGYIR